MQTYIVLRRSAWETEAEADDAAAIAARIEDEEMDGQVRLLRSYLMEEEDGTLGIMSIYQAEDDDILMEHSQRAELPLDELIPVADTQVTRDDP